jgi:hypothetical protein
LELSTVFFLYRRELGTIQMLRLFDLGAGREVPLSALLLALAHETLFIGAGLQDK